MSQNKDLIQQQSITQSTFSVEQSLMNIEHISAPYPEESVITLLNNEKEVTPFLLQEVEKAISNPEFITQGYIKHLYALYILAQFRNKSLFSKILKLLYLPIEQIESVFGNDFLVEPSLPNMIASSFDGDLKSILEIIENRQLDRRIRAVALNSLVSLVITEQITTIEITDYLQELLNNKLEVDNPHLWTIATSIVMDLYLDEVKPIIFEAFEKKYVDEKYTDLKHFIEHFELKSKQYDGMMDYNRKHYHFVDAIKDMKWWAYFQAVEEHLQGPECFTELFENLLSNDLEGGFSAESKVILEPNEICFCGSWKKYKNCCINNSH